MNSLPQGCTASRVQILTQGRLTPKPGFLTMAPSRPFLQRTSAPLFLEAPQITPQTGISPGNLYTSSYKILPVVVGQGPYWLIFSDGKTKA